MKKLVALLIAGLSCVSVIEAQSNKSGQASPPVAVVSAFEKAFPGSSKLKWEKEGPDFEANFVQNGKSGSAVYTSNGQLKETEWDIPVSELPKPVTDYIAKNYKGAKVKEAAKITQADGAIMYEAEVNGKDLIFDASGKFVKQEKY
ncbi:PepSY-like domain-containing protein [Flavihumibacter profundi]|uniref:PepSY-like domain-containing protein n=1 Tax=Flavihumibacter profundi TaxID=2716883 RepID=UPI001CC3FE7E|nr:PepSY-like domain-containing protein [Flavihumibacter profundi]MBZ5858694.1 PepSY-like domain-containing protein [Flavihumibacter profundi]